MNCPFLVGGVIANEVRLRGKRLREDFFFCLDLCIFLSPQSNNRSDFLLPGSFTDPRPSRPTKEEVLNDLAQLSQQFVSSPQNSSGVVMRNSGERSNSRPNSRPNSLLIDLEPLEEDETPAPSPQVKKNPAALFDFEESSKQESTADGTDSPVSDDLRERSVSADTLTFEDPLTPTPSGENISTPQSDSKEVKSVEKEKLIDLSFAGTDNEKVSKQLNQLGLKDLLDGDEDEEEDESSSLLIEPTEEKPGIAVPKNEQKRSSKEDLLGSSCDSDDFKFTSLDSLGDLKMEQVICIGDKKTGRIRYIGPTEFAPGVWIGVELDTPSGTRVCIMQLEV